MFYVNLVSRNEKTSILHVVSDFWSARTYSRTDHYSAKLFMTLGTSKRLWNFDFYWGWELCCRDLKAITDREVCCFMISCKNSTNIDSVIDWLVKHSKSKNWEDDLLSCDVNLLVDVPCILMAALCYWSCGMGSWLTGFNSSDSCLSICSLLLVLRILGGFFHGFMVCIFVSLLVLGNDCVFVLIGVNNIFISWFRTFRWIGVLILHFEGSGLIWLGEVTYSAPHFTSFLPNWLFFPPLNSLQIDRFSDVDVIHLSPCSI